jgi:hypothetical protein
MNILKVIAVLLTGFISSIGMAQIENVEWVSYSDSLGCPIQRIAVDTDNNIVATGTYRELSIQGFNLTACCENDHNVFIVKWDPFGNVIWVRSINTAGGHTNAITTDSENNIIVTAEFRGKMTINGEEFVSEDAFDQFVVKYNENGKLLWAKQVAIRNGWTPMPVRCDDANNVYFITRGQTTVGGVLTDGKTVLTKLNENGGLEWALPYEIELGPWAAGIYEPMEINSKNEIILFGVMLNDMTFGGEEYTLRDTMPVFMVAKIGENGEELNAVTAASTWIPYPNTVTVSDSNEIYISAEYYGEVDLGDIHLTDEYQHGFLAKLDDDLNFIAAENTYGNRVFGAVTNGAGPDLTGFRDLNLFIRRYDENCVLIEELNIGEENVNIEYGRSLASFDNNEIVVGGSYADSFQVGNIDVPGNRIDQYGHRAMLIKFGCSLTSNNLSCERKFEFNLYPNPVISNRLNVSFEKEFGFNGYEIYDFAGRLIDQQTDFSGDELTIYINVSKLRAGAYIIKLTGATTEVVERFVRL